jgi:hypothetical protein
MTINRNASIISLLATCIGFTVGAWLHFYSCSVNASFWSDIFIGVFASGILSMGVSLVSYFSIRHNYFFKINALLGNINMALSSPILVASNLEMKNVLNLRKQQGQYREMQEITNDFRTFFHFGFKYRQVKNIHSLMLDLTDFAPLWEKAEYCAPDEYGQLLNQAKTLYQKKAVEFQTLCKAYCIHLSQYKGHEDLLNKLYPYARI